MKKLVLLSAVLALCMVGCEFGRRSPKIELGDAEGLLLAPTLRFSDIPIPRGFVLLADRSWTYEAKGGIRLADLYYKGKAPMQSVVDFFVEQMPISGWEKEMVVGPETKKRLRFNRIKRSERCQVVIERTGGYLLLNVRID